MFKKILPILGVFVILLSLCVPFASAAVAYVEPPSYEEYDLVAVYRDYSLDRWKALYITKGHFDKFGTAYYNEAVGRYEIRAYRDSDTTVEWYEMSLMDTGKWGSNGSTHVDSKVIYPAAPSDMKYSIATIYYYGSDEPFFPTPLWKMTEKTFQAVLQGETIPQLTTTMWTLLLCGVGLIASLVVLPLFGKVLRRFLG